MLENKYFLLFILVGGGVNPFRQNGIGQNYRLAELKEEAKQEQKKLSENEYAYPVNEKVYKLGRKKEIFQYYPQKCNSDEEQIRRHFQIYNDILSSTDRNKFLSKTPMQSI